MAKRTSMEELLRQQQDSLSPHQHPENEQRQKSVNTSDSTSTISHSKKEKSTTSKPEKKMKEIKLNINSINITPVKVVAFIQGKGRYIIGGIIALLLVAYVYGVMVSFMSEEHEMTVNVITAIALAFTTKGFFKFIVLVIVIVAMIALFTVLLGKGNGTQREFGKSDALGSASYATQEEKNELTIETKNLKDMPSFFFGQDPETGLYVGLNPECGVNANFAICGSQGTMKSWGYVRNNIVQLVKMGQSIVITDPKGEMYRDMSKYLIEQGYIVKQLNMKDMFVSDSWNVLEDINTTNIDEFCKAFIMNTVTRFDNFYDNLDLQLLKALCLYVKYEDKDIEDEERTLGQAYNMLEKYTEQELDNKFLELPRSSRAYQTYMLWMKGDKAKKNSLVSLAGRFNIFQNSLVKKITGVTDIDLALPAKKKCAYFIILNDQNRTYNLIASIFINSMLEKLVDVGYNSDKGHTDVPIHFLFDEFPIVGKLNDFNVKLGTLRGYGIGVSMIFQNLPQFMNRYPDNEWEELLGACDMQLLMGTNDETTANYYSNKAGKGTIIIDSERRQHNNLSILDTKAYTQVARTESYQQMDVITPDEVERLRQKKQLLLFIGGSRPFRLNKVGFDKSEAYPVEQHHARNHVPMWLIKAKEETNFVMEYGGIYKLGLISDMPPHFIKLIDMWRYEALRGEGGIVNDDKLPISYAATYEALDLIKMLNKQQGDKLTEYLEGLVQSPDNTFISYDLSDISNSDMVEEIVNEDDEQEEIIPDTPDVPDEEPEISRTVNTDKKTESQIQNKPQPQLTVPVSVNTATEPDTSDKHKEDLSGYARVVRPKTREGNNNFITSSGRETEIKSDPEGTANNKQTASLNFNVTFKKGE